MRTDLANPEALGDALRREGSGEADLLPGGQDLSEAALRDALAAENWHQRLLILNWLIDATVPRSFGAEKARLALNFHRRFLASSLPPSERTCDSLPAALLMLLSAEQDDVSQARRYLAANQANVNEVKALIDTLPGIKRALETLEIDALPALDGAEDPRPFHELSYRFHQTSMEALIGDPERDLIHRAWFDRDMVDYHLHDRCYEIADCLRESGEERWLTVGDGRFGLDAIHLKRRGFRNVLATDISDALLKQTAHLGLDIDYAVENAERLSFDDESFDYTLCKESYHHFPRPMIALYEMLRVARRGVVLVEPQDPLIGLPVQVEWIDRPEYGSTGNYKYPISRREMEKVALGLDLPAVAFKGLNTGYIRGVEFSPANAVSPIFIDVMADIALLDGATRAGRTKPNLLMAAIFKTMPSPAVVTALEAQGWDVRKLPRNPFGRRQFRDRQSGRMNVIHMEGESMTRVCHPDMAPDQAGAERWPHA